METAWEQKSLEELGKITSSRRIFKKEYVHEGVPFFRTKEVKELAAGRKITTELFISKERYEEILEKSGVPKIGDILLTAIGTIGEIYVVKDEEPFYFKDGNVLWLKNFEGVDSYYLKYALIGFVDELKRISRGAAYNALPIERLKKHKILAPSPEQQKHIVAKIDELFSHIDAGINSLKKSKELLKKYRQSVLKAAMTGELTQKWREKNKDKLESADNLLERIRIDHRERWEAQQLAQFEIKGTPPKNSQWKEKYKEPETPTSLPFAIPKHWTTVNLDHLLSRIEAGKSFRCDERPPSGDETGIVKVSAVSWGEFDSSESKTITDPNKIIDTYRINEGDLLFSRANTIELVGACVMVKKIDKDLLLSDKILRFIVSEEWKEWILICLRSWHGRNEIESLASGNQDSMRNIGQAKIKKIRIPALSNEEMKAAISIVNKRMEAAQKLEIDLEAKLNKAEKTKQSILASAFSGKLI